MDKQTKGILGGAAIGVLAGAIAGILMAPKSGKETRDDIKEYLVEIKDNVAEELSKIGTITKDKYDEVIGRVVNGYEVSKKISAKDANDIKGRLEENFKEVVKATQKPAKK